MPQVAPWKGAALSGVLVGAAAALLCIGFPPHVGAQTKVPARNAAPQPAAEQGVRWQDLGAAQRSALRPLERDWSGISANQKQKWLDMATRFPSLQPDEQARIQARMSEWAKLTTEQRSEARLNFQQAKQVSPQDRQAQWEAYQSLPAEERGRLAARAASAPGARDANRVNERSEPGAAGNRGALQSKSNIVPNPAYAVPPKPVAPTVLQAQPGATTSLISKRPTPPPHQQTGLPKIAASPNFVDKETLLPKRGPQGAAARSPGASAAEATRQQ